MKNTKKTQGVLIISMVNVSRSPIKLILVYIFIARKIMHYFRIWHP